MISKLFRLCLFILFILAIGIGFAFFFGDHKNGLQLPLSVSAPKNQEKYITPFRGDINSVISSTGTVEPQNRLEIKPPINGRIEEILVQEGEQVKKNQVLAWMSSTERAALLDASRIQGDEALNYWQEVYKPTPLIAPIDGEVIVRALEPGQTVTSTTAVLVLSDRLIIKAQVDETDIGKVKLKMPALITLDAYPQEKIKGVVDHISYESTIVNNVTIYEVEILPDKVPDFFRSGMSATVDIVEQNRKNVLLLPQDMVEKEGDQSYVFVLRDNDNKPFKTFFTAGVADEKNVEILAGLSETDKIVADTKKYTPIKKHTATNPLMPGSPSHRRRN